MERKIGDIKDKKLKAENITLAAIYNILFTNDIVCSLIVEMLSELRKSRLCRFRVKQQGNKLEQLMLQYEKKINKIAGHRAFFMADANQYIADEVQPDLLKMEYSIKLEFDKCRIENSALLAKVELTRCMAELACLSLDKRIEEVRPYNKEVTVGSGAGLPMFMNIPGENLKGVYSANEFLTRINLMKAYREDSDTPIMDLKGKTVAVVGGGNVAMDAARCSKRLGAEVYVVYRRGMEELPARHEEVEHAIEEGVIFKTLNNPVQINGDEQDCVKSMTCIEMELGEPDASGRRRPVEKKGSEFDLSVDAVIMSLGTSPNPLIKSTTKGLEVNKKGGIIVNEEGLTSRQAVYAGGDAVTGAATVILAMGAGKLGAKSIDEYLSK